MAYRFHGRADVDPGNPHAFAICDRCGFLYNHVNLRWQFQWIGPQLQNLRILVCDKCTDAPQEQLRTIILPPDPLPIWNARPQQYDQAETDYIIGQDRAIITGQNGSNLVKQIGLAQQPLVDKGSSLEEDGSFSLREDGGQELRE